jgi:hypothetical protein
MTIVSPPEFSYFTAKFGSKYPYNEISKTRRRYYVKWIITNKSNWTNGHHRYPNGGIPRNTATHTAIPSSAIDDDLVQYLIIHKKAQPVPAKMGEILDWMYCWGRGIDVRWYSHVVDWFQFLLHNGIHLSDKMVLKDCVEYRIRTMVSTRGLELHSTVALWHAFFEDQYDLGVTHFYDLSVRSMQWVEGLVPVFASPTSPAAVGPAIVMSSP